MAATPFSAKFISHQNRKTPTSNTSLCPSFLKDVYLHDWWLIQAGMDSNGRRLGVGGFASRETQGIRVFRSAAIVKRHDPVILETADGITITLSGLVNRSTTLQNGFPAEVCNHFLFGFPYDWEEYAAQCYGEDCKGNKAVQSRAPNFGGIDMSSDEGATNFPETSLGDLPVTHIRDLLMCTFRTPEYNRITNNIFDNIQKLSNSIGSKNSGTSAGANIGSERPATAGDFVASETVSDYKRTDVKQKLLGDNAISPTTYNREEKTSKIHSQSQMETPSSRRGIAARSMTRLNNTRKEPEDLLQQNSKISAPKTSGKQHGNESSGKKIEVNESSSTPALRRSSRLINAAKEKVAGKI